jgi:predicted RNA binding protein YcfA (HicA-like mRNA interferase family)
VLGSVRDGHDWSLEAIKEHACGIGLTTSGASGRALNITSVNLLRQGLVTRLQDGKWRLPDQSTPLPLDLVPPSTAWTRTPLEPKWRHRRMKFRDFIRILLRHGFELDRQSGSSHRVYKGRIGGKTRLVVVAGHSERRYQARHLSLDDPAVGTAQTHIPRMRASSGERHGELMVLSVAVTVREQSAQYVRQELEPNRQRSLTMEQGASFMWRQVRDALKIEENRFLERTEDLLEGATLDRDVEVEADRLPIAVATFGIAAQISGRQL